MSYLISVHNLNFSFPGKYNKEKLFSSLSFFLMEKEILGIIGRSGSGKSTLAKILSGLLTNYSGDIYRISGLKIQLLFQNNENIINPERRVSGILEDSSKLSPFTSKEIEYIYKRLGIEKEDLKLKGSELSGGKRLKVALARILIAKPDVLILDEPFTALDSESRNKLQKELIHFNRFCGISIIVFSHKLSILENFAHRVISINK